MGLFSREPAEKKAFNKALYAMVNKPNKKTFAAIESASSKWPTGWQGYLFIGLCYDLASCEMPFDPERGAEYHKKAKAAGNADGCKWLENFYETYEESAGNFRIPESASYYPRVLNIRRVTAAILLWYTMAENHIMPEKSRDALYWQVLLEKVDFGPMGIFKKSNDEQLTCNWHITPILDYVKACGYYTAEVQNEEVGRLFRKEIYNDVKEIIKASDEADKIDKANITTDTRDLSTYIFGYMNLTGGGPGVDVLQSVSRKRGWDYMWLAADHGCMPALHLIADSFGNSQMQNEIVKEYGNVFSNVKKDDAHDALIYILSLLEKSYGRDDSGAMRRMQYLNQFL